MRILVPGYDDGWDEYSLPCVIGDIPPHAADSLTPWMRRWIGLGPDEIRQELASEWASLREPLVSRFRDVVLRSRPSVLANEGARWYLALKRAREDFVPDTLYLESPLPPDDLERCLKLHRVQGHDSMREFSSTFGGLRNHGPLYSGNFERPEEWTSLRGLGWDQESFTEECRATSEESLDALILYTTACGDMVLRYDDDCIAWALMAENRVIPFVPSFADFLEVCTVHYDRIGCLDYDHWKDDK